MEVALEQGNGQSFEVHARNMDVKGDSGGDSERKEKRCRESLNPFRQYVKNDE